MSGICRLVALTALVGLPDLAVAQAVDRAGRPAPTPVIQTASLSAGWIEGSVTDERSHPVAGAAVTAQGRDLLLVETDSEGRFTMRSVPAGTYLVRVQGRGYVASKREFLQVLPSRGTTHLVRLQHTTENAPAAAAVGTVAPHVLTAGVSAAQLTGNDTAVGSVVAPPAIEDPTVNDNSDDHSEIAWRLRHVKRSVLRDTTTGYIDDDDFGKNGEGEDYWHDRGQFTMRDWATDLGRASSSFLTGTALSGRVQLMTASAFDEPFEALSSNDMPSGVAYFSLGAPVSVKTAWSVEAAVMQGDVSSWFVAGTYATSLAETHGIDIGTSYARQRYQGPNPQVIAAFRDQDNSRNVGGVQIYDRWTLSQRTLLTYGARYEHYDYLKSPSLLSPSVTLSISPVERTWIRGSISQRMSAPGAEEFVPQPLGSLVLPPQQTFAAISPDTPLGRERARTMGIAVEHEVASLVLGARYFQQDVDDQIVTVFGVRGGATYPVDLGHYGVATGGSFVADGWGFSVSRPVAQLLRTSLEYRTARAYWGTMGEVGQLMTVAPSAMRPPVERVHDLTARVESEIPVTATRILAIYRLDTAYARSDSMGTDPVAAARFDVQIHQALPFLPGTHTHWELLLAVRNLLHDTQDPTASLYDELLVVRPPKRVVGGVTVQF
jgi:TonB dependent receptor/Carboxypeptidase regulatory-like domain